MKRLITPFIARAGGGGPLLFLCAGRGRWRWGGGGELTKPGTFVGEVEGGREVLKAGAVVKVFLQRNVGWDWRYVSDAAATGGVVERAVVGRVVVVLVSLPF